MFIGNQTPLLDRKGRTRCHLEKEPCKLRPSLPTLKMVENWLQCHHPLNLRWNLVQVHSGALLTGLTHSDSFLCTSRDKQITKSKMDEIWIQIHGCVWYLFFVEVLLLAELPTATSDGIFILDPNKVSGDVWRLKCFWDPSTFCIYPTPRIRDSCCSCCCCSCCSCSVTEKDMLWC